VGCAGGLGCGICLHHRSQDRHPGWLRNLLPGSAGAGAADNIGSNYPFVFSHNFPAPTFNTGSTDCATNGYNLESGFSFAIAQGLTTYFPTPTLVGQSQNLKSTYAIAYNLAFEEWLLQAYLWPGRVTFAPRLSPRRCFARRLGHQCDLPTRVRATIFDLDSEPDRRKRFAVTGSVM
jgi:hypothetical protein